MARHSALTKAALGLFALYLYARTVIGRELTTPAVLRVERLH